MDRSKLNVGLAAVVTTVADVGTAVEGHLYASMMGNFSLGEFNAILGLLTESRMVESIGNHQIRITGKGRELAAKINDATQTGCGPEKEKTMRSKDDATQEMTTTDPTASASKPETPKAKKSAKPKKVDAREMARARGKVVKPAKEAKPKKEKVPAEPQVVFAFRLSEADRDTIHKAAGPAKATKFVRAASLAAANGDLKGFEALVAQAKANLK